MIGIVGLGLLFISVFGVFALQGGNLQVLIDVLPAELTMILGAAIAAAAIANPGSQLISVSKGFKRLFHRSKWSKQDYLDTIVLVSNLLRTLKIKGPRSIEADIERPFESPLFANYPKILGHPPLISMITDTIRLMVVSTNSLNPYALDELLDVRILQVQKQAKHTYETLTFIAGALPALGIVACVLGIVKTMAAIDQPPAILGVLIGAALLGTFLGVFLAYGIFEPLAKRLLHLSNEDSQIFHAVKQVFVATLHGHPQPMVIEAARIGISERYRPSFDELFEGLVNGSTPESEPADEDDASNE